MAMAVVRSKADLDDAHWLDRQVATLGDGIEAARDIWANWTDLRNVGRLHPGQSCGDFIASQLGGVRLDLPRLIAALPDMSNRQLAAVAGVNERTVRRERGAANAAPEPDAEIVRVIGADGKSYPGRVVGITTAEVIEEATIDERTYPAYWADVQRITDLIEALETNADAPTVAATVPSRRRAATARRLRKLGTYLGGIAWSLERNGDPS
jgi:hypothetical protein